MEARGKEMDWIVKCESNDYKTNRPIDLGDSSAY